MGASENVVRRKWMLYGLLLAIALWMLLLACFGVLVIILSLHASGALWARAGMAAIGVAAILLPVILGIIVLRRRAKFTASIRAMLATAANREEQPPVWLRLLYACIWTLVALLWLHRALDRGSTLAWIAEGLFAAAAILSFRQLLLPPGSGPE